MLRSSDADSLESMLLDAPIATRPDLVRLANPLTYVKTGVPPFLVLHGLSNTAVPAHQSVLLYEALAAAGNNVTLYLIKGLVMGSSIATILTKVQCDQQQCGVHVMVVLSK